MNAYTLNGTLHLLCMHHCAHTLISKMASRVITFITHSVSAMHHLRWELLSPFLSAWHWINANEIVLEQISNSKMNNVYLFCFGFSGTREFSLCKGRGFCSCTINFYITISYSTKFIAVSLHQPFNWQRLVDCQCIDGK